MATPALRALRAATAGKITLVGKPATLAVLAGGGFADAELANISTTRPLFRNYFRTIACLRRRRFDLGVLLPNSFRSALIGRLGGIRNLAGYNRDARGWLLRRKLAPLRDADGSLAICAAIDYYLELARFVGAPGDDKRMFIVAGPDDRRQADDLLAEVGYDPSRPLVMLNPGAAYGPSKLWSAKNFAAVANELSARRGAQIIVNAAPPERQVAAWVEDAMTARPILSFANRANSIPLLKGLVARCDLVITNDTGARHIAAALGRRVVTIFGSTDPDRTTLDYPLERIVRALVACSPCQKRMCPQPPGPMYHICMNMIHPGQVVLAATELLDSPLIPEAAT